MKLVKRVVTYNEWTVLEGPRSLGRYPSGKKRITCKCRCVCGTEKEITWKDLKSGVSKSCGCSHKWNGGPKEYGMKTHGMSRTKMYVTWRNMLDRCSKPRIPQYKYYGARGITVCERWAVFENFYADMGDKPTPEHTIERKDTDGNYCPENCVWATPKEQANNRSSNYKVIYHGEKMNLIQLSELTGINHQTLWGRIISRGLTPEEAVGNPVRQCVAHQNEFTYAGETMSLHAWAAKYKMTYQSLWHRMHIRGWKFEDAINTPMQFQTKNLNPAKYTYDGIAYSARAFGIAFGIGNSTAKRVLKVMSPEEVIAKYATKRP